MGIQPPRITTLIITRLVIDNRLPPLLIVVVIFLFFIFYFLFFISSSRPEEDRRRRRSRRCVAMNKTILLCSLLTYGSTLSSHSVCLLKLNGYCNLCESFGLGHFMSLSKFLLRFHRASRHHQNSPSSWHGYYVVEEKRELVKLELYKWNFSV